MSSYRNRRRAEANRAHRAEGSVARDQSEARVEANRANAQLSTGPRTEAGKAAVSTNAIKHGLTSNLARLDPRDSPSYQQHLADLTSGLAPANPVEELLIRDLAMLKARLDRIEAAEYATLMFTLDGAPPCPDSMAAAYLTAAPQLTTLEKTERFLRRNYMQTWSRLERIQRERKKQELEAAENQPAEPIAEMTKQSHPTLTHSKHETVNTGPKPSAHSAPTDDTASPPPSLLGAVGHAKAA